MIVFSFPGFKDYLSRTGSSRKEIGSFRIARYKSGELHISIKSEVKDKECVILGSIAPPDDNLVSIGLLAHTLKKEGASRVKLLAPFLAYTRHDKDVEGESVAVKWVGSVLKASGINEVVTFDLHSEADRKLFAVPLTSLSPAELFARKVKELHSAEVTVVAPDRGGIKRAEELRRAAKIRKPIVYLAKRRTDSVEHVHLYGKVSERAVVVDDIIDTGDTLISACRELKKRRVKKITIVVSHGVLSGDGWKKLFGLGVDKLYMLDTVPKLKKIKNPRVKIIPSADIAMVEESDKLEY